jgi:F0F1-type ATP synthase assembly protein I
MHPGSFNGKEFGRYLAIGQVGLEMVAPILVGLFADRWWGSEPWGTVIGAGVGLVGGLAHLIHLTNKESKPPDKDSPPRQEAP